MNPHSALDAVLLDVGGVMLVPDPTLLADICAPFGGTAVEETIIRAHYDAMTLADDGADLNWEVYCRELYTRCGVAADQVAAAIAAFDARTAGANIWSHALPGARDALERLTSAYRVGIVSNSDGQVERLLREAEMCQVGPGSGVPVEFVIDSALVGVAKPDPAIFELALGRLDVPAARAVYVGDTRFADVVGATAARLRVLHLDPYDACPQPAGHEHVAGLGDVAVRLGA